MIALIAGAAVVGVLLGLLGSGGSIATVPLLVYAVGHDEKQAVVESLAIVGIISLYGAVRRAIGREIDVKAALWFVPSSTAGAWLGTSIGLAIPGPIQLILLACLMFGAAALMLRPVNPTKTTDRKPGFPLLIVGFGVGIITGIVGIGGGFLIVPAFVIVAGLAPAAATGTSLALIFINCVVGFAGYAAAPDSPEVEWPTVWLFGLIGIVGVIAGQRFGKKISQRAFKRAFAALLLVLAPVILTKEIIHLRSGHSDQPPSQEIGSLGELQNGDRPVPRSDPSEEPGTGRESG